MAKVIKELVTRWTYKVDAKQILRATQSLKALRNQLSGVRKSSIAFGNKEAMGLRKVKRGWDTATASARRYGRSAAAANASGGFLGVRDGRGGRGGRGGRDGRGGRGGFASSLGLGSGGGGGFGSRLGSLASVAGAGTLGAFAVGAGGVGLGGGALATASILALAGAREQAEVSFTGFLKSGEKAREMLDDLTTFARTTPFQIPQLRELSSALLAGGFAAEEIIPTLRSLGDVTRGNTDKLNRMLVNFIQVKTVGKASTRDLNQFALAGIPIYGKLQEVTGLTGEGVRELGRQGKITFKIVKEAFKRMTGAGGLFFKAMELQSKTFFGRLSNIKDGLIDIGETMGREVLPEAKAIAEALQEWLIENKLPIVDQFRTFIQNMKGLSGAGGELFGDFNPKSMTALAVAAAAFTTAVAPMAAALALFVVALEDYGAYRAKNPSLIGDIVDGLKGFNFLDVLKGMKLEKAEMDKLEKLEKDSPSLGVPAGPTKRRRDESQRFRVMREASRIAKEVRIRGPVDVGNAVAPVAPFGGQVSGSGMGRSTTINQTNNLLPSDNSPEEAGRIIGDAVSKAVRPATSN